jgi:hypothetical protein
VAAEGEAIFLSIAPDPLYRLKSGTLKYNDGTDHVISGDSFIMPASDVTVTGEFELIAIGGSGIPVTSITLNKTSLRLSPPGFAHNTETLTVTEILPPDATNPAVTWSTSDDTVVTVDSSGLVEAVKSGEAMVIVTAADGSGTFTTCAVLVLSSAGAGPF